jgi:hypothetical protein
MAVPRVERRIPSEAGVHIGRSRAAAEPVVVVLETVPPRPARSRSAPPSGTGSAASGATAGAVLVSAGWDTPERVGRAVWDAVRGAVLAGSRRRVLWFRRVRMVIGPPSSQLRRRSLAECHVRSPVADAVSVLGGRLRTERVELLGSPEPVGVDPSEGVRAPGRLHVRWSWPPVPVWVSIRPWSAGRSVVGITIRGGRRPRYPRRYFVTCHQALHELRAVVQDGGQRVGEP